MKQVLGASEMDLELKTTATGLGPGHRLLPFGLLAGVGAIPGSFVFGFEFVSNVKCHDSGS